MPVEGRDLSSRRTQHVVRDLEIGEPINSEECSETAEGVARESEGRSRLPFLCPVRQDQPRGHPGSRLRPVPRAVAHEKVRVLPEKVRRARGDNRDGTLKLHLVPSWADESCCAL